MRRGGDDENYFVARSETAEAMNHAHAEARPAFFGRFHVSRDLGLGHSRIMLERHGKERRARFLTPANAGECDDGPDIGTPARKLGRLIRGIERLALQTDGGSHRAIPASAFQRAEKN